MTIHKKLKKARDEYKSKNELYEKQYQQSRAPNIIKSI